MFETSRLIIIPLTSDQLKKYTDFPHGLAFDLGLVPSTVINDIASIRVLEKNGFIINHKKHDGLIFKFEL